MSDEELTQRLDRIERTTALSQKEVLTIDEVCSYTGYKKPYIYKLACSREIPHYKQGRLFFRRKEIESWLTQHKVVSNSEIESKAIAYALLH